MTTMDLRERLRQRLTGGEPAGGGDLRSKLRERLAATEPAPEAAPVKGHPLAPGAAVGGFLSSQLGKAFGVGGVNTAAGAVEGVGITGGRLAGEAMKRLTPASEAQSGFVRQAMTLGATGMGQEVRKLADRFGYVRSPGPLGVAEDVAGAVPQLAGGVAAGAAGTAVGGPLLGMAAGAGFFGMTDAGAQTSAIYQRLLSEGVPEDEASARATQAGAVYGVASGALEFLGIGTVLRGTKFLKALERSSAKRAVASTVGAGVGEGVTEAAQGVLGDAAMGWAREDWGEFKETWNDLDTRGREFMVGAILSTAVRGGVEALDPSAYRSAEEMLADIEVVPQASEPQSPQASGEADSDTTRPASQSQSQLPSASPSPQPTPTVRIRLRGVGAPQPDSRLADGTPVFKDRAKAEELARFRNERLTPEDTPVRVLEPLQGAAEPLFAVVPDERLAEARARGERQTAEVEGFARERVRSVPAEARRPTSEVPPLSEGAEVSTSPAREPDPYSPSSSPASPPAPAVAAPAVGGQGTPVMIASAAPQATTETAQEIEASGTPSGESKQPWDATGEDVGTVYHGGKARITELDPSVLQSRDAGFYGRGFYVTTAPHYAQAYGSVLSEFTLAPDAKVLRSSLNASDAPPGLVDAVKAWTFNEGRAKAEARGKLDPFRQSVEELDKTPIDWKNAVDRYAEGNGYDVVMHSDGEIVVKNTEAIRAAEVPIESMTRPQLLAEAARLGVSEGPKSAPALRKRVGEARSRSRPDDAASQPPASSEPAPTPDTASAGRRSPATTTPGPTSAAEGMGESASPESTPPQAAEEAEAPVAETEKKGTAEKNAAVMRKTVSKWKDIAAKLSSDIHKARQSKKPTVIALPEHPATPTTKSIAEAEAWRDLIVQEKIPEFEQQAMEFERKAEAETEKKADRARRIAEVANTRPMPRIVETFELQGSDGKWYTANGFPMGVKYTGEKRSRGFVYESPEGQRYGQTYPTREAAETAWRDKQAETIRLDAAEYEKMTDARLAEQEEYWLKKVPEREQATQRIVDEMKPKKAAKPPAGIDAQLRDKIKTLEGKKYRSAGDDISLEIAKRQLAANPAKWTPGDGVGYRIGLPPGGQINRGFRVVEVDAETKQAKVRQVADTGITSSGGDFDRIEDQWVDLWSLVRDKKYDAREQGISDKLRSAADKLESDARAANAKLNIPRGRNIGATLPPAYYANLVKIGAAKIMKGVAKFADWAAEMVATEGKWIESALQDIWADANDLADDITSGNESENITAPQIIARSKARKAREAQSTSARKDDMADDREALGLDVLDSPARRSWQEALDTAKARGLNEIHRALQLATEVINAPRAYSDIETAGLVKAAADLKKDHRALVDKINAERDPVTKGSLVAQMNHAEQQFDVLSRALRKSGTEKGRALASQKLTLDADMSLIAVKARARAAKGSELTEAESARITELTTRLEAANARAAELEAKLKAQVAQKAVKQHAAEPGRHRNPVNRQAAFEAKLARARELLDKGCR